MRPSRILLKRSTEATTGGILQLPERFSEPGLLVPGRKPVGPVVVDWSHPLARHVFQVFLPQSYATDTVENSPLSATSGASVEGGNAKFAGTSGNGFFYSHPCPVKTELTIIIKLRKWSAAVGGIFSDKDASNWTSAPGINVNARSGYNTGVGFNVGATGINNDSHDVALGVWHTVVCTWIASSEQKIYINEVEKTSAGTPAASYTESSTNLRVGTYYDEANGINGEVEYIYAFSSRLPGEQITNIIRNPYQFLRPAAPNILLPYSAAAEAPAPGTDPLSTSALSVFNYLHRDYPLMIGSTQ